MDVKTWASKPVGTKLGKLAGSERPLLQGEMALVQPLQQRAGAVHILTGALPEDMWSSPSVASQAVARDQSA